MSDEKKLVRVDMLYDDGTVSVLEGPQAQEWLDWLNGALLMSQIHGGGGRSFNWKVSKMYGWDGKNEDSKT